MDAFRRLKHSDENALVNPSKQASMAATHALQQARAKEAPPLPKRAVLQPVIQNGNAKRSSSMNDTDDEMMSDATIDDLESELSINSQANDPVLHSSNLNEHTHTIQFSDDEDDEHDVEKLKLAIVEQPKAVSNPDALFPLPTLQSQLEFNSCAQIVADTVGLLDNHDEDVLDPSMVLEYTEDIFKHLQVMELRLLPNKDYMAHQKELDWSMRGVLVDWLVKVHHRFNLLPETLFLCINYIDRFLSQKEIALSRLQLVGAVALFVAAKFEEINYLSVHEVSQMVENQFEIEDILSAEKYMIDILDFNLGFPGPMSFLRRVSKADDYELETRTLAKYLLEITIMDERFVAAPPSYNAAVAHYMARHMLRQGGWTPRHVYFSSYTEEQLIEGVCVIRELIEDTSKFTAIYEKYSERKFRKAAQFVNSWLKQAREYPQIDFHTP